MNSNDRFFLAFDLLKKKGLINTYVELAQILETNKAGVNDLKTNKKKISVDNIKNMILSYPNLSLRWLIMEEGDIEAEKEAVNTAKKDVVDELIQMQKKEISRLEQEIIQLQKTNSKLI